MKDQNISTILMNSDEVENHYHIFELKHTILFVQVKAKICNSCLNKQINP